jgi:hypothetical protein
MKLQLANRGVSWVRFRHLLTLSILLVGRTIAPGQGLNPSMSPKKVLEAYRQMDSEGQRLSKGGWYDAAKFFVHPDRPPDDMTLAVMEGERVDDASISGNRARVQVPCSAVGQIDSYGRFTSVVAPYLRDKSLAKQFTSPVVRGPAVFFRMYDLVLTDLHWEFGPGEKEIREVKGPPAWRIETFESEPWVTSEVAIRYLKKLRDESNSDTIKTNADKSIAILRHLP